MLHHYYVLQWWGALFCILIIWKYIGNLSVRCIKLRKYIKMNAIVFLGAVKVEIYSEEREEIWFTLAWLFPLVSPTKRNIWIGIKYSKTWEWNYFQANTHNNRMNALSFPFIYTRGKHLVTNSMLTSLPEWHVLVFWVVFPHMSRGGSQK